MTVVQNDPALWLDKLPVHDPKGHKYDRGIAVIYGAPKMTGATRLAAKACARMGAGLVKVIAPEGTGDIYRSTLSEEIIIEDEADFKGFNDPRLKAFLIGPGTPKDFLRRDMIRDAASFTTLNGIVLDAGAFLLWRNKIADLRMIGNLVPVVATPHDGEFKTFFPSLPEAMSKIELAEKAASDTNATIVLKGAHTVIAGGGDVISQERDVPELATAGTGDVLAGMVAGLIAQGMDVHDASAASVWIHAEAAARFGKGMVASDLPEMIPIVLQSLNCDNASKSTLSLLQSRQ